MTRSRRRRPEEESAAGASSTQSARPGKIVVSSSSGRPSRQSSQGKKSYQLRKPPNLARLPLDDARQRQIADRDDMRIAVAGARMAAAIAERIELLDIAERHAGLLGDPGAQADLEGAMPHRIEWAGGQRGARVGAARRAR